MAGLLTLKSSVAPRRPPKVVLMAPPGVEVNYFASFLSQKYKLIVVDVDQLVKDYIRREGERATDLR
jgi:hypothetical protein